MLKKIVLDVLKPHEPNIAKFSNSIAKMKGVVGVNVSLYEIDREVENVKITIEGDLDYPKINKKVRELGGSVHSVDVAASGDKIIDEMETLQDRSQMRRS